MKEHYKLYKAGKLWLTACIVALGMVAGSTAYADQQVTTDPETTVQNVATSSNSGDNQDQATTSVAVSAAQPNNDANDQQPVNKVNDYSKNANTNTWTNSNGEKANGWQNSDNNWYYFNNGQITNGWQNVNHNWYYMSTDNNVMQTGLQTIDNSLYYLNDKQNSNSPYGAMQSGWQNVNNNWYYFADRTGQAQNGWQYIGGRWYYFDLTTSIMKSGLQPVGGRTYYFNDQHDGTFGAMQSGWQKINNRWYGFGGPNDGAAYTGWRYINNNWYYFNNNGEAQTGWMKSTAGNWYYFDDQNAWALRNWQYLGNHWYYFDPSQTWMETGWQYLGNQWYYLDPANGGMVTGTFNVNGSNYYFQDNGAMAALTGWQKLNNHWYYFNNNNTLKTDWFNSNGRWYYFDPTTSQAGAGWQKINNRWYYFDPQNAWALGGWQYLDNQWYYLDPTNAWMETGWQKLDNQWYYFDQNNGNMLSGLQSINGKTYFLNDQHDGTFGAMLTGQRKVGNNWYVFGDDGAARQGWINGQYYGQDYARYQDRALIEGQNIYYFDQNGNLIRNQNKDINGVTVYFNNDGVGRNVILTDANGLAQKVATAITNKDGSKNVLYDWTNQDHNYKEFAIHDMANLLAGNNAQNDPQVIEKLLARNDLLQGKVISSQVYDLNQNADAESLINNFVNGLPAGNYDDTVVGTGYNRDKHQLAIILFKPGQTTSDQQASTIHSVAQDVYKAANVNVNVDNGLTKGQAIDPADTKAILAVPGLTTLLTGEKGQIISQEVLKTIFAGLPGNVNGLVGAKTYKHGNDSYHYVYWLEGQSADDKLQNFLNANKNAKYGDQLTVNYSATLTYGPGTLENAPAIDETPESKKTADEISLAYQKGTETGARYDTVKVQPIANMKQDTIRGVDISSYQSLIDNGVQFYDFNGQPASMMKVLADAGVNYVRIRLWVDPYNPAGATYGGGNDDEANVLKMAKEAESYGMHVLLAMHYSDFWADPATQLLPKAWEGLSDQDLNEELYLYNKKVINDFKNAGVTINMVQLGNEITKGFLGLQDANLGVNVWSNDTDAARLTNYLKSASRAFREASPTTQLAVHIETPDMHNYDMIMNTLKNNNVDYDILASSYYPFYGWWGNNPTNLANVEKMVNDKYGKKFMVAEYGWPFTTQNADGTPNNISWDPGHYAVSPQGQVDQTAEMYKAILSNSNGIGAFYWEPSWIPVKAGWDNWEYNRLMGDVAGTGWASINARGYYPDSKIMYQGKPASGGSSWDNITLFDDHGHPLQSLKMYNGFLNGYQSPQNTTSSINAKVAALYKNDGVDLNNPLTVGSKLNLANVLSNEGKNLLNGIQGTAISTASLKAIFNDLQDGINSDTYTDKAGQKYHYEFWLVGNNAEEKLNNFLAANQGIKYGDPLNINYSATLVKDGNPEDSVTSPIKATVSEVWGLNGVTIADPLAVGDSLPAADLAVIQNAVNKTLTGVKGTAISDQAFDNLQKQLPGVTSGLAGQKIYTVNGNQYHYVYWLKTSDIKAANKGALYGDPLNLTYSASLKWIDPNNK